ncbi:transposase [Marinitoga sp. 38H-ov]|nr:transposase [Marinitoga sp. 38H-ov]
MKNRNKYSPDFKLQVVKEYLNSDKSLSDIAI